MPIGIIGAMDEEIEMLKQQMTDRSEITVANCLFIEGKLFERDIVLLKSGIGKVNAAMAATIMHERYAPSHVINTGSAGGFADSLQVGDIVISSKVVHHDVDCTAFDYAYGQVPGMPAVYVPDKSLVMKTSDAIKELGVRYTEGIIATGDSFMSDSSRVAFVKERFPAMIAGEMEAAAIAQVCYQYGSPFVIIRALSDIAGKDSSVSFDAFLETAAENAAKLIMKVIPAI
ncbi:5'-methylthioadenosine/S-adenosylhomocysteine nucleosidase [Virgibacillus ihumii]|uniref:5'-methylthioadenosine/S-adenosylhomocysteine nucleosidase n=1 Tax=Virgibacillus ihumii TaxID=2686091 RepID=UPI00157CD4A3|nr:5'-methylthioadenosine/S-adenosylhomocysteine nucleosidase [Virgibacillus ihumii]